MFDNVPSEYVHDVRPDLIFPNERIDYVYNTDTLNATEAILEQGIDQSGWGERTAVVSLDTGKTLTYNELHSRVDRFANVLRDLGVEAGDRVLWRFDEAIPAQVVQLATWKVGGIAVPSVLQERARELEYYLADTEASIVVAADREFQEVETALENAPDVEEVIVAGADSHGYRSYEDSIADADPLGETAATAPLDVASIYYTGGTTGKPKGCIYSHAREVAIADLECGDMGRDYSPEDVIFTPAPLGHGFGNGEKINFPFRFGAKVLLGNDLSPVEMLDVIEDHDVSIFSAVPTLLRMMLNGVDVESYDLSALELLFVSGEILEQETAESWRERTGVDVNNAYGMTCTHAFITSYRGRERSAPGISIGKPYSGYELKVVDIDDHDREVDRGEIGRLAFRGPTAIIYWNNIHPDMPERQETDTLGRWSLLDDAVRRDEDGNLWFVTRLDNMIQTGGRQVAAPEVEEVLNEHEAITEAAVVGKPDETRGEIVTAFVTVTEDAAAADSGGEQADADYSDLIEDVTDFAKAEMAPYKYPREIEVLDSIPKDEVGKIQRRQLRDRTNRSEERRTADE